MLIELTRLWADGLVRMGYPQEWSGQSVPLEMAAYMDRRLNIYFDELMAHPYQSGMLGGLLDDLETIMKAYGFINDEIQQKHSQFITETMLKVLKPKAATQAGCSVLLPTVNPMLHEGNDTEN
jgi:hypothetical protein